MRDLRGLPDSLIEKIARHLVATGLLLDEEPELALAHAKAASSLAPRISATREAVGIAAYHAGEYALALVELRAARRMDGSSSHLPMMADAERGLGRAERALDYLNDPGIADLDAEGRAELLVVVSGARRDLGQPAAAVLLLQDEARRRGAPEPWTPRLWYAYAESLLAAGRIDEAVQWFSSTAAIDEGETDAAERVEALLTDAESAAEAPPPDPPDPPDTAEQAGATPDADETLVSPSTHAPSEQPQPHSLPVTLPRFSHG
jgi:tetratricopeptide (TPR) repeat protein